MVRQSWRLNNFVATYHDSRELNNFLPSFILHLTVFVCRFVRIGEKTCKVTNETAERVYGLVNVTGSVYILHKGNQRISKKEVF